MNLKKLFGTRTKKYEMLPADHDFSREEKLRNDLPGRRLPNGYIELEEDYERSLYRIRALKDFGDVKAGDLGGYVEKEANLSQDGAAWIYDRSIVIGNARIDGDAQVRSNRIVRNNVKLPSGPTPPRF